MQSSSQTRVGLQTLREIVSSAGTACGFDLAGVAPSAEMPELEYFCDWVEAGRGGEMAYLERRNPDGVLQRSSLRAAFPWARSVIVCAASYHLPGPLSVADAQSGTGWIARYAQPGNGSGGPADYHAVMLGKLRQMETLLHTQLHPMSFESRCYVDTGPLIERVFARYAGVGWLAKNTCVIHPQKGSWLLLATIVTSIDVDESNATEALLPDRCGSCTRCIDACPTNALDEPYRMDATRCIAYLTIEKRGSIAPDLREGIGRNVFGCDICQDVCPWNAKAAREAPAHSMFPEQRGELVNPSLAWLASLDRQAFNRVFRGSPVERTKWQGLIRNVAIAMGNSGRAEFLPQLERWAALQDEPVLAESAQWAMRRIAGPA